MDILKRITLALVIIGALNWGIIGFFQFDFVATLFGGEAAPVSRLVYALIGISGIVCIGMLFNPMENDHIDSIDASQTRNASYGTEFGEDDNEINNHDNPYKRD